MDVRRAAAILYGDWGTSKAYVIGLAFAIGYASFWLVAAMCLLTALVGVNYIVVCRLYPEGGGVHASVRHRSEVISVVGACLLIADYLVRAAISALFLGVVLYYRHVGKQEKNRGNLLAPVFARFGERFLRGDERRSGESDLSLTNCVHLPPADHSNRPEGRQLVREITCRA